MKKINTLLLALAIVAVLLFGSSANIPAAHAQATCLDAAGAPIPCPPTEEPSTGGGGSDNDNSGGGSQPSGGNSNPATVATVTPEPTNTPLPLAAPTDDGSTGKAEWSGTCKGENTSETAHCIAQFTNGCTSVGGSVTVGEIKDGAVPLTCKVPAVLPPTPRPLSSNDNGFLGSCTNENFADCREQFKCENGLLVIKVDLYATGGTSYDFYCIPDEEVQQLILPLAVPTNDDEVENWEGVCTGDDLSSCSDTFKALCDEEGGAYSEFYEDNGSLYAVCENSSETSPAPTEAPAIAAAPEGDGSVEGNEDWDEECSWATCWAVDFYCWSNGGSGYIIEDAVGNTGYHCDMPEEKEGNIPPGWWMLGALGIGIGVVIVRKNLNRRVEVKLVSYK